MFSFKIASTDLTPRYMTQHSAAADLYSTADIEIAPQQCAAVPTGLWIDKVDWERVPKGFIPEIQIRCRSGLAFKSGVMLANGVGTVDADYPDEIKVLLWNSKPDSVFKIKKGDRIAQILVALVARVEQFDVGGQRTGGFGSTGHQ